MWQIFTILLSLTLLTDTDTTRSARQELVAGEEAPHFFAHFLDGGDFFLSRYVGPKARPALKSPVVFAFFTTSCLPCRKEIPDIHKISREYPDISVFLINVGENRDLVKSFIKTMRYTLPVLLDPYRKISEKYLAGVTPTLVTITSAGKIDLYKRGYKETDKKLIKQAFERLSGKIKN